MHESSSAPPVNPLPPAIPTAGETKRRIAFQADHGGVGFSPLPLCEDPGERWIAYWLAEDGKPRHVLGKTLGDVLGKVKKEFG